jgi:hypothetical protein
MFMKVAIATVVVLAGATQSSSCQSPDSNATPGMVIQRSPDHRPYEIKYRRITDHKEIWVDVSYYAWQNCKVGTEYPSCVR